MIRSSSSASNRAFRIITWCGIPLIGFESIPSQVTMDGGGIHVNLISRAFNFCSSFVESVSVSFTFSCVRLSIIVHLSSSLPSNLCTPWELKEPTNDTGIVRSASSFGVSLFSTVSSGPSISMDSSSSSSTPLTSKTLETCVESITAWDSSSTAVLSSSPPKTLALHRGQQPCRRVSQGNMHSVWKACPHGSNRRRSPGSKSSMQMEQVVQVVVSSTPVAVCSSGCALVKDMDARLTILNKRLSSLVSSGFVEGLCSQESFVVSALSFSSAGDGL
mmetsp:Transcript_7442/g.17839  ORF Transcript_7442/g.17839 Transcript_7442/m.17839 type:complete len:275 (+) Transcript_7442:143-967(+)